MLRKCYFAVLILGMLVTPTLTAQAKDITEIVVVQTDVAQEECPKGEECIDEVSYRSLLWAVAWGIFILIMIIGGLAAFLYAANKEIDKQTNPHF
jgi:hypothetical protein